MSEDFRLHTNAFGQLVFTCPDGTEHANAEAVRAFPITAPDEGLSLLDKDGHELAWIPSLSKLDDERHAQVLNMLRACEFMPQIQRIVSVSTYRTPSTWKIETDRGPTQFILKTEDDIRRLAEPSLLIAASRGIQFLIRDPQALDNVSRKILGHFL